MFPRREILLGVHGALHVMVGRRTIEIVLHVVFAGP